MAEGIELAKQLLLSDDDVERGAAVATIAKLAHDGNPEANYAVATWHIHGVYGYEKDLKTAETYLRKSAELLVPDAFYDLAVLEEARKLPGYKRRAFHYYIGAAVLGDKESVSQLYARMYNGYGTFKDKACAELFRALADGMHDRSIMGVIQDN